MKRLAFVTILATTLLLAGCKGKTTSTQQSNPTMPATSHAEMSENAKGSSTLSLANATLTVPDGWEKVAPSSQMRVAQLQLKDNPEVELAVFFFGEQDMVQENIDRWKGQYAKLDNTETLQTNIENVTAIKLEGTFKLKATPMAQEFTEAPDYATLAAIVPTEKGPFYLKVSAAKDIINAQQQTFIDMLNSYHVE